MDNTGEALFPTTAKPPTTSCNATERKPQLQTTVPDAWEVCVHDIICGRCRDFPDSQAVVSWDGSFTYRELDELSDQLASMLCLVGTKTKTFIAICMEKSRWVVVAVLGVMKIGAAFSLLDPSHPLQRITSICKDLSCPFILTDTTQSKSLSSIAHVIVVQQVQWTWHAPAQKHVPPAVSSKSALYVAFTSGSTGKAKGVVIEHRAYCSGAKFHIKAFGIDRSSRVLQFASYAFDVSIMETLSTLMAGGCVCIINETERTDPILFAEAVRKYQVSHAFLTPSFARTVQWKEVESISTLILGGEAMRQSDPETCTRGGVVHLFNAYGPAECSVNALAQLRVRQTQINNIGYATGAVVWVVEQDDPEVLISTGKTGELLIEGPIVGRGYINSPEETRRAFIDPPSWLRELRKGKCPSCVYRTGDLVSRNHDGSLTMFGRKDRQVKMNGSRVECEEIEEHITQRLPEAQDVAVEKVTTFFDQREKLAAWIVVGSDGRGIAPSSFSIEKIQSQLRETVPAFMVPSLFIPIPQIPRTPSGKVDRHLLRETVGAMSPMKLRRFAFNDQNRLPPTTDNEHAIRRVYSDAFKIPAEIIGMDDTFIGLGGDSITAALLASYARHHGLMMTVRDILGHPKATLEEQARKVQPASATAPGPYVPFSLLGCDTADVVRAACDQCHIESAEMVEDAYPCTALQEGMITATLMRPDMYTGQVVFGIPEETDLARLKEAWQSTADANPILRTRIVQAPTGLVQVVLRDKLRWMESSEQCRSSSAWAESEQNRFAMPLGNPLARFYVVAAATSKYKRQLVVAIHHAAWDQWTLELIRNQVEAAYSGGKLTRRPFAPFIGHLQDLSGLEEFWATEMADVDAPVFPDPRSNNHRSSPTAILHHAIQDLPAPKSGYTVATHIHLAWSLLITHYTDCSEAVYGVTVHGRGASVEAVDQLAGPTIATVPFRVNVRRGISVTAALDQIRNTTTAMMPYEQAGLQNIAGYTPDTKKACSFQSHLNIQVTDGEGNNGRLFPIIRGSVDAGMEYEPHSRYALNLVFKLGQNMAIDFIYDPGLLSDNQIRRMAHQFEHVLRQLYQQTGSALGDIQIFSAHDLELLQQWNSFIPQADRRCLHELVLAQGAIRPTAPAISAWDGDMAYGELVSFSSAFANHLGLSSVRQGSTVAILLEKSKWTLVAILGALQTGAACVLLDPEYPRRRMQSIICDVSANVLITSPSVSHVADGLCTTKVNLSPGFIERLSVASSHGYDPRIDPEDPAFILFTSGSTGRAKGIVMTHRTITSSIRSNSGALNVTSDTRALHLSSYAFDVSVYEIFTTLAAGGCVCIPSDFERKNDLAGSINRHKANWAFLTPSASQTLSPSEVPLLTTVVLGGEPCSRNHIIPWKGRTLLNGYGPAEATICAVGCIPEDGWTPGRIGHVVGGVGWITVPSDPSQLAAIGAVGELLLEGPFLAKGYLNLSEATAGAFIDPPPWRLHMSATLTSRLYRSGDLVQYQDDGSIRFIGRKDTQVKLRGQRVDLGEVESNILRLWPTRAEVAVEVIMLAVPENTSMLAAFIEHHPWDKSEGADDMLVLPDNTFRQFVAMVQKSLASLLPSYMVPSSFFPVKQMPHKLTGKINRPGLQGAILTLTPEQLRMYQSHQRQVAPVVGKAEKRLQKIWEEVLRISSEDIGADDSFLYLGADSVAAMKMVAIARRHQFYFTLANVMDGLTLSDLAKQFSHERKEQVRVRRPPDTAQPVLIRLQSEGVLPADCGVVGMYSLTEAQELLIHHSPWTHFRFSFQGEIRVSLLRDTCRRLVELHSILRSIFVVFEGRPYQLILECMKIQFYTHTVPAGQDLASFCDTLCQTEQEIGVCKSLVPTRFSLVSDPDGQEHVFIMRLSHAQYDGFCIPKVVADLEAIHSGRASSLAPTHFESYLSQTRQHHGPEAYSFWREYLDGATMPTRLSLAFDKFESNSTIQKQPSPSSHGVTGSTRFTVPPLPPNITLATAVKAAVALVLARVSGHLDLVLAHTVGGRASPTLLPSGTDQLVGPCTNFAPFRVTLQPDMTVREYLAYTQTQYTRSVLYEFVELGQIVNHCTDWTAEETETQFDIIVQHQQVNGDLSLCLGNTRSSSFSSTGQFFPRSKIWICSTPSPSGKVDIDVVASSARITAHSARKLAEDIRTVMLALLVRLNVPLRCIDEFVGSSSLRSRSGSLKHR